MLAEQIELESTPELLSSTRRVLRASLAQAARNECTYA